MSDDLAIRNMTRAEVGELIAWAAAEGWNPGLHDADVFWATDPDAFIAAELKGELIGGGAITSYGGDYGFMGFFIMRPEFRGRGFGSTLWHARREQLIARLKPGATIGMDGVFDMQPYYAKGGFQFSHRNMRFRLEVPKGTQATCDANVMSLREVPFAEVKTYDRTSFPAARDTFLSRWIAMPDTRALGYVQGGALRGYGVIRRCGEGCKIGPLFADDAEIAETLFAQLLPFASAGPVFLDAPENNTHAMALVQRHGMEEVFGCARMYLGAVPNVAHEKTYGVTTFELG